MDGKNDNARPASKLRAPVFSSAGNRSKRPRLEQQNGASTSEPRPKASPTSSAAGTQKPTSKASAASGSGHFSVGTKSKNATNRPGTRTTVASRAAAEANPAARTASAVKGKTPQKENQPATKAAVKRKRAPWDTKGQLSDLRQEADSLKEQFRQELTEKEQEIQRVESRFKEQLTSEQEARQAVETSNRRLKDQLVATKEEVEVLTERNNIKDAELKVLTKDVALARLSEKELQLEMKEKVATVESMTETIASLRKEVEELKEARQQLERQQRQHETERRKLHNTIQELKGNIRVFCRVRPSLDNVKRAQEVFSFPDLDHKKVTLSKPQNCESSTLNDTLKRAEKMDFTFDKVFKQDSTQEQVFQEISQLVQSALDGYNVCIFAYGQTGSGKTYTMQGPEQMTRDTEGMIPRSIVQIFESAEQLRDIGWKYTMEASFIEIYNETINDLLGLPGKETKHDIKIGSGEVIVTNMTTINVDRPQQVGNLFERATRNRHVAETNCNARSSRSHSVFMLKISGNNDVTSETCSGTLNLVDLAGSERLKESKSEGDRLKETQCINTSLSALGNVIMALAAKKPHIPYRDSKLTFLLQNALGGNSKTLMFVNVSPHEEHFNESVNSLRFATKVNNCSIGTAKKVK